MRRPSTGLCFRLETVPLLALLATGCGASNNEPQHAIGGGGSGAGGLASSAGGSGAAATGGSATGGSATGGSATGGVSTGGNSTGGASTGGAPHVVGNCSALSDIGVWDNVTPPNAGIGTVAAFAVAPSNPAVLYLKTCGQGIFKSTDCGGNWQRIDDASANLAGPAASCGWTMEVDPTNPDIVYTNDGYGQVGLFKSTDGGVHWNQLYTQTVKDAFIYGGFTENVAIDPTDPRHVTATPHFSCQGTHSSDCMAESTDGGESWRILENTPGIAEGAGMVMTNRATWYWAQPFGGLYRTTNGGSSWQKVSDTGMGFRFIQKADDGFWYAPSLWGVKRSSDGVTWVSLDKGPKSDSLTIGNGTIYTSLMGGPYVSTPVSNPTAWKIMNTPTQNGGAWLIHFDPDHNLLYATAGTTGFWRVRTK